LVYQHAVKPLPFDPRKLGSMAMDVDEHSYQMNFGAAAPKYDVFFPNVNCDAVNCRLDTARTLHAAMGAAR
jgi:hypothetical protein